MPTVCAFQQLNQFGTARGAEFGFETALKQRFVWHNPVDSAHRVTSPEVHVLFELFRYGFRRLDEHSIDVSHVEIAIRSIGEVARSKPGIRGGQEFNSVFGPRSRKTHADRPQDIPVNQVSIHFSGENIAPVLLWKYIAVVDSTA